MRFAAVVLLCVCSAACVKQAAPPPAGPAPAAPPAASAAPETEGDGEIVVGPEYAIDPDLTDRGAPRGRRFDFVMQSTDSKIFRGEDTTLKPEHQHPFQRK